MLLNAERLVCLFVFLLVCLLLPNVTHNKLVVVVVECIVDEVGSIEFRKDAAISQAHLCPFLTTVWM